MPDKTIERLAAASARHDLAEAHWVAPDPDDDLAVALLTAAAAGAERGLGWRFDDELQFAVDLAEGHPDEDVIRQALGGLIMAMEAGADAVAEAAERVRRVAAFVAGPADG